MLNLVLTSHAILYGEQCKKLKLALVQGERKKSDENGHKTPLRNASIFQGEI